MQKRRKLLNLQLNFRLPKIHTTNRKLIYNDMNHASIITIRRHTCPTFKPKPRQKKIKINSVSPPNSQDAKLSTSEKTNIDHYPETRRNVCRKLVPKATCAPRLRPLKQSENRHPRSLGIQRTIAPSARGEEKRKKKKKKNGVRGRAVFHRREKRITRVTK